MLFFPAGDPEALAMAITAIFNDDNLATSLSVAARKRARVLHDSGATIRQLTGIYSEMLESRGALETVHRGQVAERKTAEAR